MQTGAAATTEDPIASAVRADGKALGMQKLRQRNPCEPTLHLGNAFQTVADAARSLSQADSCSHVDTWRLPISARAGVLGRDLSLGLSGADSGIAVVGDSVAELTAAQGADLFIGFRGFREDAELAARVAWIVRDYSQLTHNLRQYQVAFIGSGHPPMRMSPLAFLPCC